MSFLQKIKVKIGEDVYRKLNLEADKEVYLALKMSLINKERVDGRAIAF